MKNDALIVKHFPEKVAADMVHAKRDFRNVFIMSLCLVVAILVAYGKVKNFDFVDFDDGSYITENNHVQEGLTVESIIWAFTAFHSANWHPLTWISHMLDCQLYGLNPAGHHWTNVLFHIANTLLLFFILFKMTGAIWKSAFVAALFALHPLHVESVAWVSERKDVLSTFFGLLMIIVYYRYVKLPCPKNYILVIILFSLGIMAKPMLVTFPFVLLLLDYWPLKRFKLINNSAQADGTPVFVRQPSFRLVFEKVPLFIIVVISCILTFLAQQSENALVPLESLSLKTRIANALISYISYVLKAIWPRNLAVYYPHPVDTLPVWQICGAVLLISTACFWAIRTSKKYPYIAVGLFWYLGTLIPVIGLVQVSDQAMADRYTYIPLIGLFIIIAWGVADLFKKWHYRKIFFGVSAVIILSALTARTFSQVSHWRNTITLFENAVKVTENNYRALNNLGNALIDKGKYDEAVLHFTEALRINPQKTDARNNLASVLFFQGKPDEAIIHYNEILNTHPQETDTRNNLANVLFLQGKPNEAIFLYNQILQTNSEYADVHYNLAYVLSTQGRVEEAELHYREALRIDPKYLKAHYNLGNILINQGKIKEAVAHFAEAIRISPDYAEAYNKIGLILFREGKFNKAEEFFSKAIQINPNYSEARKNLEILMQSSSSGKQ